MLYNLLKKEEMTMRNKLVLAALGLVLSSGVAMADHWRGEGHGRVVVETRGRDRVVVEPRHDRVYVNGGGRVYNNHVYLGHGDRYYFNGGRDYRVYHRPVIRERYYDYRVRPRVIVENYDPMPGYVWIQGGWQWNGAEWQWFGGHYAVEGGY
jgi:hypothetical protein